MNRNTRPALPAGVLHLFQPGLELGGQFTALTPERALWMLAYLAAHDRWVARDELSRLLWPDADPEAARSNLRQLLYRARQLGLAPALEAERTQLRWAEGSDLHQFRKAYREKDWERAVAVYRGELLQGFEAFEAQEFSAWLEIERRDLAALWREAAQNQAKVFGQAGRFGEAAGLLERILKSDPLAEDVLCDYLRLAARSGQRDRALELFRAFARQLDDELGLEPRAETRQLFEQVRSTESKKTPPIVKAPINEAAPSTNRLPPLPTPFIGRAAEIGWLEARLGTPGVRLLSLVGPGGIGKTYLALEAARRFGGHAAFVSLVGHDAGQSLAPAVAEALGLGLPGRDGAESELRDLLEGQSVLLVLDNVEQVIEEARRLATSLSALEGVRLLFTTRVRLGLAGEHSLEVGGLGFPAGEETRGAAESYDAVRLLLETVRRAIADPRLSPDDQGQALRICRSVAGVPLALVLAGSWARMLSLGEIADELERDLDFLEGAVQGLPQRHRGMREVFAYSWRLLSEPQRQALAALSVFRGGFDRSAALAVTGASNLTLLELLDSSLIRRIQGETHRFDLHELVRQYAQERLEADAAQADAVRQRHAEWFTAWAEGIGLRWQKGLELARWFARIEIEHDNLRTALGWAEAGGQVETGIRLALSLQSFWRARGHSGEGRGWLERFLERIGSLEGTALHAKALARLGDLCSNQGDLGAAEAAHRAAAEVARAIPDPDSLTWALNGLGIAAGYRGEFAAARGHFEGVLALARELGDRTFTATALNNLAWTLELLGEHREAFRVYQESLELRTEIGDAYGQSLSLFNLGVQSRYLGDHAAAQTYFGLSLEISTALEDREMMLMALDASGDLAFRRADHVAARALYRQGLGLSRVVRSPDVVALLEGVAALLGATGQDRVAAQLLGQAELLRERGQLRLSPNDLAEHQAQLEGIRAALGEIAFTLAWREGRALGLEQALDLAGEALEAANI